MKFIKHFFITIVINSVLLYIISKYVPQLGFSIHSVYKDSIGVFAVLGIAFWITNSLLKTIVKTLTLPIKYLTLGISGLIINIILLYVFEQMINYLDIGVTVTLGNIIQTILLSLVFTCIHVIIKKI